MHYTIERLSNIRLIWQHWQYLNNNRWCCCHSYYRQGKQSVGAGGMNIAAMACLYFKQQQQNLCLATPLASHAAGNAATAAKVLSPQPRTVHSPLFSSLLFSYSLSDSFNFNAFYISARRSLALVRAVTTVMRSLALSLACVRGVHLLNVYVPACLHVCAYLCVFVCSDCVLCDCLTACWLLLWRWPVYL